MAVISGAAVALGASAVAGTAIAVGVGATAVGAATSVIGGAIQSGQEHKAMRNARNEKEAAAFKVKSLQDGRQTIINPYAGVESLSDMATDLTNMMSNPFDGLSVATKAAEFQAEEADISLANTLDLLRSTGASAGGATALAQAAIASKKGISASIEQQEKSNADKAAKGEQQLQAMKQQEAVRVQGARMGEAQRMQNVDVAGKEFMYQETEARETAKMNRVAGQQAGAKQAEIQARQDKSAAIGGIISGVGSLATSLVPG